MPQHACSWYQPAIDAYQLALMREFNKLGGKGIVQPLIYGTFQAYLRRYAILPHRTIIGIRLTLPRPCSTPMHLVQSFKDAESNGYTLGVKLVRGAYHPHEVAAHQAQQEGKKTLSISPDAFAPVWTAKEESDRCYNECAKVLLGKIQEDIEKKKGQRVGILFGTHNWDSCRLILRELVERGLGRSVGAEGEEPGVQMGDEVTERLTMGQLFGMCFRGWRTTVRVLIRFAGMNNALTDYLVNHTRSNAPMVIKYAFLSFLGFGSNQPLVDMCRMALFRR